jgi:hypothetical protein
MKMEALAGIGSIAMTFAGWFIAQADPQTIPSNVSAIITQAGGLGLAVWLVYHHTTITIPTMQRLHAEERATSQAGFQKVLDEKRIEYFREIDKQREQFAAMITQINCKYRGDQ